MLSQMYLEQVSVCVRFICSLFAVCVQVAHFIMKNTGAMPAAQPTVVAGSDPLTGQFLSYLLCFFL